jgi:hypothetical protein
VVVNVIEPFSPGVNALLVEIYHLIAKSTPELSLMIGANALGSNFAFELCVLDLV